MLVKFLVCSSIICLVLADVKHLSRTYLPPSLPVVAEDTNKLKYLPPVLQEDVQKPSLVTYSPRVSQEIHAVPNLTSNEVVESDTQSVTKSKEAASDPFYGGGPFGAFPGAFPNVGFPGQFYPRPVFPPQAFPGQGLPGPSYPPTPGFVSPNLPTQFLAGQGIPVPGFPAQIYPGQGFPAPGFYNPGYPAQAVPNYPVYFSEQLQAQAKEDTVDDKPRVRLTLSDTQYDDANGGYLYKKPSIAL